jgi:hypothetical protein
MADGLQDKKRSLDSYYAKWDDRFPSKHKSTARFRDVIDLIEEHAGPSLQKTRFRKPALFYSLFLAIYELRYERLGDFSRTKAPFGEREGAKLTRALAKLYDILKTEVPPKDYLPFVTACQRQTDNIGPRRTRRQTILREFAAPG